MKTPSLILTLLAITSSAQELENVGILGNSGEQGSHLVHLGPIFKGLAMGPAFDHHGTLWDRSSKDTLIRLALDGRLISSHPIPDGDGGAGGNNSGEIAILGETLIIRPGGTTQVATLPLDAKAGTPATVIHQDIDRISRNSHNGLALAYRGNEILTLAPSGELQPLLTLPEGTSPLAHDSAISFGADGEIYILTSAFTLRYPASGKGEPEKLQVQLPGERTQLVGNNWYGHAWHSTMRRFDLEFQPDPGVVLGGNSGSFIGRVAEQREIENARGLAQINPALFAISGNKSGVIHLLEWQEKKRQMSPVRRIGAITGDLAFTLVPDGTVLYDGAYWKWNDGPTTPLHDDPSSPGAILLTHDKDQNLIGYGLAWDKPAVFTGTANGGVRNFRYDTPESANLTTSPVGIAEITAPPGKRSLLLLDPTGELTTLNLTSEGNDLRYDSHHTTTPASPANWTSLANITPTKLLAATDGSIITLEPEGETWKETSRWNSWANDNFGKTIHLTLDQKHLWVSDTENHRVLCFDLESRKPIASFGKKSTPGNDLETLDRPTTISASGHRALIFDSANQRLVKLELKN